MSNKFAILSLVMFASLYFGQDVHAQRLKMETRLNGPTLASGKAKYESRGNRRKFNANIEDTAPAMVFTVMIRRGGQAFIAGTFTTNQFGQGGLDIDTGEGFQVPTLMLGDIVEIRMGGVVVVSGALRRK